MADYGTIFSGANGAVCLADGSHFQDVARTTAASSGDPVGSLTDTLGQTNFQQSTAGSRPTLTTGSGKTWLAFDGVDTHMNSDAAASFWTFMPSTGGDAYMAMACRSDDTNGVGVFCAMVNAGATNVGMYIAAEDRSAFSRSDTMFRWHNAGGGTTAGPLTNGVFTQGADHVLEWIRSGTDLNIYVDNVLIQNDTVAAGTSAATNTMRIGREYGNIAGFELLGRIYGAVWADTIPSAADRTAIQNDMSLRTVDNPLGAGATTYAHNVAAFLMSGLL